MTEFVETVTEMGPTGSSLISAPSLRRSSVRSDERPALPIQC